MAEGGEDNAKQVRIVAHAMLDFPNKPTRHEFYFPGSKKQEDIVSKVVELTDAPANSFTLNYRIPASKKVDPSKTFAEQSILRIVLDVLPVNTEGGSTSKFASIKRQAIGQQTPKDSSDIVVFNSNPAYQSSSTSRALTMVNSPSAQRSAGAGESSSWSSVTTSGWYTYTRDETRSKSGYVGLSNQGATCYMNSLIQTLYMTPEFRRALYKWNFEQTYEQWKIKEVERVKNDPKLSQETDEQRKERYQKDSIPRQLQLLFSRLQLRDVRAVKTKDLTHSFGWTDSEAFTQHDVQELCRVLFDALEKVFHGTEQENLIQSLYEGEMKDYVKCKGCNTESSRVDKFLDVPLVIKGFGETTAVGSIEEALEKFVTPEILDGNNQYFCSKCNAKVDAAKGLKFTKFPYLLTLQLKRFDFDYETMRRIKLNDRVTFPFYLPLNRFLKDDFTIPPPTPSSEPPPHQQHHHDPNSNNNVDSEEKTEPTQIEIAERHFSENSEEEDLEQVEHGLAALKADSDGDSENSEDIPTSSSPYHQSAVNLPSSGSDGEEMQEVGLNKRKKLAGKAGEEENSANLLGDHRTSGKSEVDDIEFDPWQQSKQQKLQWDPRTFYQNYHQGGSGGAGSNSEYYGNNMQNQTPKKRESPQMSKEEAEAALKEGPYVYELYSVLVHRGNALGGHYYAYIKSFDSNRWFEFNDSSVSEIEPRTVMEAFGDDESYSRRGGSGWYSMFQSSANAYMLLYRRIDPQTNIPLPKTEDVPVGLNTAMEVEDAKAKKKREMEEYERSLIKLTVNFRGGEKVLQIHEKNTLTNALKEAAKLWEIDKRYPEDCMRFRNYNHYTSLPCEPWDDPRYQDCTLEQLRIYSHKTLVLETREPDEKFPEYRATDITLRVVICERNSGEFKPAVLISVDGNMDFADLKILLSEKSKIPLEKLRIVREPNYMGSPKILEGDSGHIKINYSIYDGTKIYVEFCEDPESPSASVAEMERTANMIEIKFNHPDRKNEEYSEHVSKKMLLKDFKDIVKTKLGLDEDFRLCRGTSSWKIEIKEYSSSLDDCRLFDGITITVEKGRPLLEGETKLNFMYFDPYLKKFKEYSTFLFECPINEEIKVLDLKKFLSEKLSTMTFGDNKDLKIEIPPEKMRLREIQGQLPGSVFSNSKTLKRSVYVLYDGKSIGIQEMDQEETDHESGDLSIFIQRWFPAKYELGPRVEITVNEGMLISDFKKHLADELFVSAEHPIHHASGSVIPAEKLGVAKISLVWSYGINLLEIPDLEWDKPPSNYYGDARGILGHSPLYLRDGDVLLIRDNTEELKKLSGDEKRKIEKENKEKNKSKGGYYSWGGGKEEALTINLKT